MNDLDRDPHVDVLGLLTGELLPSRRGPVLAHVRGCDTCRDQFVVLAATMGEVHDAARHAPAEPSEVPPLRMDRGSPAVRHDRLAPATSVHAAGDPASRHRRAQRPVSRGLAAAMVVVAALVLLAVGIGVGQRLPEDVDPPQFAMGGDFVTTVPLVATDPGSRAIAGSAAMTGMGDEQQMFIALTGLRLPPPGAHFHVWLLNTRTGEARHVGVMTSVDRGVMRAVFSLPERDVAGFDAVDVSQERDALSPTGPTHSVLRGILA